MAFKHKAGFMVCLVAVSAILLADSLPGLAAEKGASQVEWERTVERAKKEGQVTVYISNWGAVLDEGVFQKNYPQIKVVGVVGGGGQITQRVLSERRAGKHLGDVAIGGSGTNLATFHVSKFLDPIKPALMLPEIVDESKWWLGKHSYLDTEGQYVFRYTATPQPGGISYNSQQVNPNEFQSFWDFLNPKWKGKILVRDLRDPGPGVLAARILYYHPKIGPEFLRRLLADMDITIYRDFRQPIDWLGTGKFALCFFCHSGYVRQAKDQGLPVDTFGAMKEGMGLTVQSGTISLFNRAPHPNAARVFINWFLSRDGQMTLMRVTAKSGDVPDSLRIDIPKDNVPEENRRVDGTSYFDVDSRPEWLEREPIVKLFEEAMAKKGKK